MTLSNGRDRAVWTLTTWLDGDDAEGFIYNYGSFDSALSGARCFADYIPDEDDNRKARAWEVRNPAGDAVDFWVADGVCPECKVGDVTLGVYEGDTGHQYAHCSEGCGWSV